MLLELELLPLLFPPLAFFFNILLVRQTVCARSIAMNEQIEAIPLRIPALQLDHLNAMLGRRCRNRRGDGEARDNPCNARDRQRTKALFTRRHGDKGRRVVRGDAISRGPSQGGDFGVDVTVVCGIKG